MTGTCLTSGGFGEGRFSSVWGLEDCMPNQPTQLLHQVQEQQVLQTKPPKERHWPVSGVQGKIQVTQETITACSRVLGITLLPITHVETLLPAGRVHSRIRNWEHISDNPWKAGVDTRVFKAHSVHGASVSAAKSKRVGIPDILKMAACKRGHSCEAVSYSMVQSDLTSTSVYCSLLGVFEVYQWNTQRISQSIIANTTKRLFAAKLVS